MAVGSGVGGNVGSAVGSAIGSAVGSGVGNTVGSALGAGVGENVSTETDRTDADDIERRRPVVSSPAEAGPRRRWPSAVAKSISAVVSAPSTTDALSTLVTYCLRRNARAWCVGRFLLVEAEGCDETRS